MSDSPQGMQRISGGTIELGHIPFDLYMGSDADTYRPYLQAGSDVLNQHREQLLNNRSTWFVSQKHYNVYLEYVFARIERTVTSQYIDSEIKAELAFQIGSRLVRDLHKNPQQADIAQAFGRFVKSYIDLMLYSQQAAGRILELTAQTEYRLSHTFNQATFCMLIGRRLFGNNRIKLWELGMGGALMDIGMTKISSSILEKKGALSADEYSMIRKHTTISERIIKQLRLDKRIIDMGIYHHERFDGSGYPKGLKGEEIPLYARIAAIADVYDAITSNRVYRDQTDQLSALAEMYEQKGKFDPKILRALMEVVLKSERLIKAFLEKYVKSES